MAVIGALAPWFGAKRNMLNVILEEIGDHRVYWEPFCGSLAVLLGKAPCVTETANDLHGDLINLARVLKTRESAEDLYRRVSGFVFHETLFLEAAERWKARGNPPAGEVLDLDRAEDFLVCSWFGRNGVIGTKNYNMGLCVRYTSNGGHAATCWRSVVSSIPDWHERLRNATILNRDAFALLDRIDDAHGTAIYCDPPYLVKGAKYLHDFAAADHSRLATALGRFRKARVVVSYYAHPDLKDLYPGWNVRSIEVTKALVSQGQRDKTGTTKAVEVLISNRVGRSSCAPDLFDQAS